MSPIRSYAKWILSATHAYKKTKDSNVKNFIERLASLFFDKKYRPHGYTYHTKLSSSNPNGVVGQALVINALFEAGSTLNKKAYKKRSQELFLLFPFDNKEKLWSRIDIYGNNNGVDYTFNHQLAFATYSLPLLSLDSKVINKRINDFVNNISINLGIRKNGRIVHAVKQKTFIGKLKYSLLNLYHYFFDKTHHYGTKEPGYHGFNLFLFSLLHRSFSNHSFFKSKKFRKALKYFVSKDYEKKIEDKTEPYFFTNAKVYLAITLETFYPSERGRIKRLLRDYLKEYYDFNRNILGKDSYDINHMMSNIYFLTFLKNNYNLHIK